MRGQTQIEKQKLNEPLQLMRKYCEKKKFESSAVQSNQLATGTPYHISQSLEKALK